MPPTQQQLMAGPLLTLEPNCALFIYSAGDTVLL